MEKDFGEITTGRGVGDFPDDPFKAPFKTEPNVKPKLVSDEVLAKAYDEVFYQKPLSGDYKYDAQMAAEALVENNPQAFNNMLYDDLDQRTQMKVPEPIFLADKRFSGGNGEVFVDGALVPRRS